MCALGEGEQDERSDGSDVSVIRRHNHLWRVRGKAGTWVTGPGRCLQAVPRAPWSWRGLTVAGDQGVAAGPPENRV